MVTFSIWHIFGRIFISPARLGVVRHACTWPRIVPRRNQILLRGAKQVYTLLVSLVNEDFCSLRHFLIFEARHAQGSQVMLQITWRHARGLHPATNRLVSPHTEPSLSPLHDLLRILMTPANLNTACLAHEVLGWPCDLDRQGSRNRDPMGG